MSVRTDVVNLIVNVGGDKAKDELNQLRKKSADLNSELKGLKKGSAEYIEKSKELKNVNADMDKLRKSIGLTAMTQKELVNELKRLQAMKGSLTPQTKEFDELQKKIDITSHRLQEVKTGMFELNATQDLTAASTKRQAYQLQSLSQIFREIPAFTYSAQTGFLGLSNNLPILVDNFKAVATSTNAATGKINGTVGALKIFGASIFSLPNLFAIAIGLFTVFSDKIFDFISKATKATKANEDFAVSIETLDKALESSELKTIGADVVKLKTQLDLAKQGFVDKEKVVKLFNETIGQTVGQVQTLEQVEDSLIRNTESYVQMMLYKTAANLAMEESAKELLNAERSRLKSEKEFSNAFLDATVGQIRSKEQFDRQEKTISQNRKRRQEEEVKGFQDAANQQQRIAENFYKKVNDIAQKNNFKLDLTQKNNTTPTADTSGKANLSDNSQEDALRKLEAIKGKILATREELRLAELDDDQRAYEQIKLKYEKLMKEAMGYTAQILEIREMEGIEMARLHKKFNKRNHDLIKEGLDEQAKLQEQAYKDRIKKAEKQGDDEWDAAVKSSIDATDEKREKEKEKQEKRKAGQKASLVASFEFADSLAEWANQRDRKRLQEELDGNEQKKRSFELMLKRKQISQAQYDKEIAKIDKEAAERRRYYALRESRRQKALGIANVAMSTIQGVARAFVDYAWPYNFVVGGLIAGAGALQASKIANTEIPEAERGMLIKGKRHSQGGTLIEAEDGEVILSRNTVANNAGIVNRLLSSSMYQNGAPVYQWSNPSLTTNRIIPQAQSGATTSTTATKSQVDQLTQKVDTLSGMLTGSQSNSTEEAKPPLRAYVVLSDIKAAQNTYDSLRKNSGLNP